MQRHIILVLALLVIAAAFPAAVKTSHAEEVALDSIIAIVNDDIILASDFSRERATLLRQNPPNLPRGKALDQAVLERLIIQSLQLQAAQRRGIRIDDASLQRAIDDMARNNKMSVTQMREALSRDGINFLEFRENIRKELVISTLTRREVQTNLNVSDSEVEELLGSESAEIAYRYDLDHILVKVAQQADPALISAALETARRTASQARDGIAFEQLIADLRSSGNNNVEGGNLGLRSPADMPALFASQLDGLQQGDVTEPLRSAAGFHILKLLSKSNQAQTTPRRVKARHILASTRNGRSAAEARELIQQIAARLKEGGDFASLAASFSEDPASASKGGDLGWFGRGEMVPQFEQMAFTTPPDTVTEPFFTDFGWHLLEVTDQELDTNPRSELESKAREQLRRKKAEEKYAEWLTNLRDNAYVDLRGFAKGLQ